ncbi:hypothetical protein ACHAXS_003046 [Conticribra weissflogii]
MNHSRPSLFTDIAKVLSGESNTLSYISSKGFQIEANCNGTLFLFTSRWGSKSIFGQLEKNGCVVELNQSELIPSIIDEVNEESRSHLADYTSVILIYPMTVDDMFSFMRHIIDAYGKKYRDEFWKRLQVPDEVIQFSVRLGNLDYSSLSIGEGGDGHNSQDPFTFASSGAWTAFQSTLYKAILSNKPGEGPRRSPNDFVAVDFDKDVDEIVVCWRDYMSRVCKERVSTPMYRVKSNGLD